MSTPNEPWRRRRGANTTDTGPRMTSRVVGEPVDNFHAVEAHIMAKPYTLFVPTKATLDATCPGGCGYHVCSGTGPCAPVVVVSTPPRYGRSHVLEQLDAFAAGRRFGKTRMATKAVLGFDPYAPPLPTGIDFGDGETVGYVGVSVDLHTVPDADAECVFVVGDRVECVDAEEGWEKVIGVTGTVSKVSLETDDKGDKCWAVECDDWSDGEPGTIWDTDLEFAR